MPALPWLVREQHPYMHGAILHLSPPQRPHLVEGRTVARIIPVHAGHIVFTRHDWLSYMDISELEVGIVRVSQSFPL